MTSPAYIPFTSLTSCSCDIGRVSGWSNMLSLSPGVLNAGDDGGEVDANLSGSEGAQERSRASPLRTSF
jgi:hypothetical protein